MRFLFSLVHPILTDRVLRPGQASAADLRREYKPVLEELTDRITPSTIVWQNQFTSDNFDAFYGANATAARAIVNQAIADWQNAIVNFNYDSPSWNNTYLLNIWAESLPSGTLGITNLLDWEDSSLKPTESNIRLDDDAFGFGGGTSIQPRETTVSSRTHRIGPWPITTSLASTYTRSSHMNWVTHLALLEIKA